MFVVGRMDGWRMVSSFGKGGAGGGFVCGEIEGVEYVDIEVVWIVVD